MKYDQLINKNYHILQRNKIIKNNDQFIYNKIANIINNSLEGVNLNIHTCLEIGCNSQIIFEYILSRFGNIDYFISDISNKVLQNLPNSKNKICFDHDKWNIKNKNYDLIISNFYLHLTNNLDLLIKHIHKTLNHNGFFIATFPGINCCIELKKSMIEADLKTYGGGYRRFMNFFSVNEISNILKKHNFITPVLEIDSIQIRYKSFKKLLNDLRFLGNTNLFFDRKKIFENKNYFNKVEKIYWENYAIKNEIILQFELILISAWKENIKI